MKETPVWFLGRGDPLERGMATHSSILAWRIPWTEEPGGLQSTGSQRVGHNGTERRSLHFATLEVPQFPFLNKGKTTTTTTTNPKQLVTWDKIENNKKVAVQKQSNLECGMILSNGEDERKEDFI